MVRARVQPHSRVDGGGVRGRVRHVRSSSSSSSSSSESITSSKQQHRQQQRSQQASQSAAAASAARDKPSQRDWPHVTRVVTCHRLITHQPTPCCCPFGNAEDRTEKGCQNSDEAPFKFFVCVSVWVMMKSDLFQGFLRLLTFRRNGTKVSHFFSP